MQRSLDHLGTVAGALGLLICIASGLARLSGVLELWGSEIVTYFLLGVAAIAVGCFFKLHALSIRMS